MSVDTQQIDIPRGAAVYGSETGSKENKAKDLRGKAVVSLQTGQKIGVVEDLAIDPDTLRVAALVTGAGSSLLGRGEKKAILADAVQVWGQDAILVNQSSAPRPYDTLLGHKNWLSAANDLGGRYVVTVDGTRVGQISDVWINTSGRVVAYELSQVFIEGPFTKSKRLPADTTHALGKDLLVINTLKGL